MHIHHDANANDANRSIPLTDANILDLTATLRQLADILADAIAAHSQDRKTLTGCLPCMELMSEILMSYGVMMVINGTAIANLIVECRE